MQLGNFANTIFKRTYALTPEETWEGCAARVAKELANDENQEAKFFDVISKRKFVPGGRYLAQSGKEVKQFNNCLSGETEVLTINGIRPIKECLGTQKLLTYTGKGEGTKWVEAEIKEFGVQSLYKITLNRGKAIKKIYATADHIWLTRVIGSSNKSIRKIITCDLDKENYYILSALAPKFKGNLSYIGVSRGIWFGDGSKNPNTFSINQMRLVGQKNKELLDFFRGWEISYPAFAEGDPVIQGAPNYFKDLPSLTEAKGYLLGWLAGYFAADGCVSETGKITISSTKLENIKFVRDVCAILGIGTYSICYQDRISNLTNSESRLWNISLFSTSLFSEFFLIEQHRNRFENREKNSRRNELQWKVSKVELTDKQETVYCAIVPETLNFCLADQIITHNCFLEHAQDSREGWGDLLNKHVLALSTGGGVGTYYGDIREKGVPIKRFGGVSSGPLSLMSMVNEVARHVMAGGKRRSALWAGLPWWHPDVEDFIKAKNWITSVKAMKEADFNFPATLDMTNISVCLDDGFFNQIKKDKVTQDLYYRICKSMCKTGEPGFSINIKDKKDDVLRNPSMPAGTLVGTKDGIFKIETLENKTFKVKSLDGSWALAKCFLSGECESVYSIRLGKNKEVRATAQHQWPILQSDGTIKKKCTTEIVKGDKIPIHRNELYGLSKNLTLSEDEGFFLGYLFGDGWITIRKSGSKTGEKTLGITFSREKLHLSTRIIGAIKALGKDNLNITSRRNESEFTIQTSDQEFINHIIDRFQFSGDKSLGLPKILWESNDVFIKGFIDGLLSSDGSVGRSICLDTSKEKVAFEISKLISFYGVKSSICKSIRTNISFPNKKNYNKSYCSYKVTINKGSFSKIFSISNEAKAKKLYNDKVIKSKKQYETVINVEKVSEEKVWDITVYHDQHVFPCEYVYTGNCCEVTSADNNDVCNLGSVNLARIESLEELEDVTRIAVQFLYNGTFKSWLPHKDFYEVRERNRRIGLGFLGLHEWCLKNNQKYEPSGKLGKWLHVWQETSDNEAKLYAEKYNNTVPVAVRAIAPTGTIGIIAETSTGLEPLFCVAYKRRFLDSDSKWKYQYVIDPTAERLIQVGVDPSSIEDSISLSKTVERRIAMQAYVQEFVDMAISSTINLPEWGEHGNSNARKFSEVLLKYLPKLRGITVYPDGSRPGQPITPVDYELAKSKAGVVFEENDERCASGVCGL